MLLPADLVTHAMYAAGHPPLAGFEAVGYSQSMPPHWTPLRDKSAELTRGLPHYDPDELIDTKAALLGNAAAFQQVMRLIVDNAETALNAAPGLSARQPEFALYDCHACHHALARSENSWRQKPGYTLHFPGRPRAPRWTFALLHVAAQLALPQTATTDASLADLETAYAIQPFGQPRQLRDSARAAEAWCAELIDALQNASFSRNAPDADRLIELIAAAAAGPLDYDTARQLAWTLDVLAAEQAARPLDTSMSAWDELLGLYRPLDAPSGFRLRDLAHQHRRQFDPASFRALLGGPSAAQ